jgi:hypothetical protein
MSIRNIYNAIIATKITTRFRFISSAFSVSSLAVVVSLAFFIASTSIMIPKIAIMIIKICGNLAAVVGRLKDSRKNTTHKVNTRPVAIACLTTIDNEMPPFKSGRRELPLLPDPLLLLVFVFYFIPDFSG